MKEETAKLLGKADQALRAATILLDAGEAETAIGRAYSAMFHTAQAVLREKICASENTGVSTLRTDNIFAKTGVLDPKFHRWLLAAFNARIKTDYDIEPGIDSESAARTIEQAREFLEAARRYLEGWRMTDDRRLIEDYLPIQAISAEASREKSVRKGHISTFHHYVRPDHAKREIVAARFLEIPAEVVVEAGGAICRSKP